MPRPLRRLQPYAHTYNGYEVTDWLTISPSQGVSYWKAWISLLVNLLLLLERYVSFRDTPDDAVLRGFSKAITMEDTRTCRAGGLRVGNSNASMPQVLLLVKPYKSVGYDLKSLKILISQTATKVKYVGDI